MTAFDTAHASVQDLEARELIVISTNDGAGPVHRHTTATRDIVYDSNVFTAIAADRGEIGVTVAGDPKELLLTLPIDHALCRRYTQQGVPPRKIAVTVYQQAGGVTETIWSGLIAGMQAENSVARFRIPSRAGEWMLRQIPNLVVSRQCGHPLYGDRCGVSRAGSSPGGLAHLVTTTVISYSGRDVRVDLATTDRNGAWAEGGELVHPSSGERRSIGSQADDNPGLSGVTVLTMEMQIVELRIGDTVQIYRGCNRTISECSSSFGARQSFGGFPQLPDSNPWTPGGTGTEAF